VALVAPASPFERDEFDRGVAELVRLGLEPVYDPRVFDRAGPVAGPARERAAVLEEALARTDVDLVVAVRGGYGSIEVLPWLDGSAIRAARTAFCGYSDVTSLHAWLGCHLGLASIHGPMVEGRLAAGPSAYDRVTFLASLSTEPLGELGAEGLETIHPGERAGPLAGGTLTQLVASLGTPYAFSPPAGCVLFLDEVGERPYRIRRMLTQAQQAGFFSQAVAVVWGQLPRCDEPGGQLTGRSVVAECLAGFSGPVLFGFPSGHTTTPLVTLPFGCETRVVGGTTPRLVVTESAAA
jgi:muramoyltetrapeptide carboxypeptidase